jgi:hypothetical protein
MHEKRNFILILLLVASLAWAVYAWFFHSEHVTLGSQKVISVGVAVALGCWLFYALMFEDKIPDHLRQVVGPRYYDADGISFMLMVRVENNQAELRVYYQNRYENPVEAIVHLRPPPPEESFVIRPGMRDVHFAFKAGGGAFGVIHQPIAVPHHVQGDAIEVKMAASSWYPRSHGQRLRRNTGMPCGTLVVDWGGNALKAGVHEVSGETRLTSPVTLHLAMPIGVHSDPLSGGTEGVWKQEQLAAGWDAHG